MAKKIKSEAEVATKTNTKAGALATKRPAKRVSTKSIQFKADKKPLVKKNVAEASKMDKKRNKVEKETVMTTKPKVQKQLKKGATSQVTSLVSSDANDSYVVQQGEEYMSAAQLEYFRNKLLRWKDELLSGAVNTVQDMQSTSANFPDPVDRASLEEEFSLELRTRDRERKLLKKIGEALQRINENNYGYCDDCGAEIGFHRLEARPTATQCIECKTIAEMRERQIGDVGKDREEE